MGFDADGQRIVASGASIADLADKPHAANVDLSDLMIEHVEIDSLEIHLGAADLL